MANSKGSGSEGDRVFVQTYASTADPLDDWAQITEEEAEIVSEMTVRNELSGGTPVVREFEARWREEIGVRYALTTNCGASALYSAFFGLGVGPGDEVICPSYNWISCIAPAVLLGARPVFCEIDSETLMIDPEDARRRITSNTRAIVAVHLWGNVADLDRMVALSEGTGIPLVEDCSHAHGAQYRGKPVGSYGRVAAWSFQGSKALSGGEAGVLATDDTEVFERACLVGQVNRIKGVDLVTSKYEELQPLGLGMKYRSHPLAVGIATVQLQKLAALNEARRSYVETVEKAASDFPGLAPVKTYEGVERGGFYGFPMHVRPGEVDGFTVDRAIESLKAQGVHATGNPYPALHTLPLFAKGFDVFTRDRGPLGGDYPGYSPGDLPVTVETVSNLLFLPVLSNARPGSTERVVQALKVAVSGT